MTERRLPSWFAREPDTVYGPPLTQRLQTRRAFLGQASVGLGSLALASLLDPDLLKAALPRRARSESWRGVVNPRHHSAKVKRVIWLYMAGGPSHLETFDYKPALARMDGRPMPESFTEGQPIAQLQGQKLYCMRPLFEFKRFGRSGQEITTLFPHIGS